MTDAALSMTQSAVEQFARQYLTVAGCTVEVHENHWMVTAPEHAQTDVVDGTISLFCGEPTASVDEYDHRLHPESQFIQQLITEASTKTPAGKITLPSADTQVKIPPWIEQGDVDVVSATFTPYYDRTAIVVLYQVSIETVSEYQTALLRAVAVDARSQEPLPTLEETFLDTVSSRPSVEHSPINLDRSEAVTVIEQTREIVVDRVQSQVDEIHQKASRAAEAEIEEYRQLQQQRIRELKETLAEMATQIEDLSTLIQESNTREERLEALEKRKELKSDHAEIESELATLRHRRDQGFPEKQQEIRGRHALEVVLTPLTMTEVEYERGDLELKLDGKQATHSIAVGYGSGVGVTETKSCDFCEELLTGDNPVRKIENGLRCSRCYESPRRKPRRSGGG